MRYLFAILFYALTVLSCSETNGVQTNFETMKYEPQSFSKIELNSSAENSCSPAEKHPGWIGIEINAPTKVVVSGEDENIAIPICGLYNLSLIDISKSSDGLQIHIHVKELNKTFSGFMIDEDHGTDAPKPMRVEKKERVIEEGVLLGGYFNPDIRDYVSFPLKEGVYSVSVEYGGEVSNQVEIQVVLQK